MAENGAVLGANGAAVAPAELPFVELGSSGLRQSGGVIREEFLRELSGPRAVRVYREMSQNDAIVGAALFGLETFVRRVGWRLEPADQSGEALRLADLMQDMLFEDLSQSWPMLLSEILSFLAYGFSYHEIVYKRRSGAVPPRGSEQDPAWAASRFSDGLIGWRKFAPRSQDSLLRWEFGPEGGLRGFVQQDSFAARGSVLIPIEKSLLFRLTAYKGNPEGRSVLRTAYRSWYFKQKIEAFEAIGVERDLAGIPLLELPVELFGSSLTPAQAAQFQAFKTLGRNVRNDEQACILWPLAYDQEGNPRYKFSLVSSAGSRLMDTSKIIERYDTRILQSLMADIIQVGQGQRGSQALAQTKSDLFLMAVTAFIDAIAEVFTVHAFPRLMALNGWNDALRPTLVPTKLKQVDFEQFTAGIKNLTQAGFMLGPEDEAYVRSELGFPEAQEGATP
jgi:hypothetical protein